MNDPKAAFIRHIANAYGMPEDHPALQQDEWGHFLDRFIDGHFQLFRGGYETAVEDCGVKEFALEVERAVRKVCAEVRGEKE